MIDIEEFMEILRTKSSIKDGTKELPAHASPSLASQSSEGGNGSHAGSGALNAIREGELLEGRRNGSEAEVTSTLDSADISHVQSNGAHHANGSLSDLPGTSGRGNRAMAGGLDIELQDVQFGYQESRKILKVRSGQ